jgi:CRP-like cAMP-binding protein
LIPEIPYSALPDHDITGTAKTRPPLDHPFISSTVNDFTPTRHNGHSLNSGRAVNGKEVLNTILLRIPEAEFEAIQPYLKFTPLALAACLQREFAAIDSVYFVNRGLASMLVETRDGRSVEVGVSGREDMIGLPLAAGLDNFTHSVVVQVPGDGFQVPGPIMKSVLEVLPKLRHLLVRQLGIRSAQFAQNAACNRLHNVRQRMARWLLVTHDRLDTDFITTTHDFLSKMIGTDRPTVSVALADLERDGIVARGRGSILIVNRPRLEQQSCECYRTFKQFNAELGLTK